MSTEDAVGLIVMGGSLATLLLGMFVWIWVRDCLRAALAMLGWMLGMFAAAAALVSLWAWIAVALTGGAA